MHFKKTLILFLFFFTFPAFSGTWGPGAVVGDPTGFSVNYFFAKNRTLHSILAFDLDGRDEFELASHFTWRKDLAAIKELPLGWFYGLGARILLRDDHDRKFRDHYDDDDDLELGPSGTLGAFHIFEQVPLEIFLKLNLTINIIEETDSDLDVMLGLHYNF